MDREIHEPVVRQLRERLPYVCSEVEEVRVDPQDPRRLLFHTGEAADAAAAGERLHVVLREQLDAYRHVPSERIFVHRSRRGLPRAGSPSSISADGLVFSEPGLLALEGNALVAFRRFEALFASWARELGAMERRYPSVIPLAVLARAGYPQAFPHHLTFASHVREEGPAVESIVNRPEAPPAESIALPEHALAPAVCYHCYSGLAGRSIDGRPLILSCQGRCYRYEGRQRKSPERLWEFTMREIVVLGSAQEVERVRQRLMDRTARLVEDLDLDGVIETANDPFFGGDSAGQMLLQRLKSLKYELRLTVDDSGRDLAAASFNHHEQFFGRRFEIELPDGGLAHSGCVAFGLERWVYIFLRRHGTDPAGWPESLPS